MIAYKTMVPSQSVFYGPINLNGIRPLLVTGMGSGQKYTVYTEK